MIGKSKPMQETYACSTRSAHSESTVLVQGENGTGKELIARAIHFNSPRKDGQFVTVNCSAFNENLLDSELFGHVKGSFTGAIKDKKGLFEAADKGTLFLDEIGDMSPTMQVKLLRVLQEGSSLRWAALRCARCDVRVVAATNKDLKEMVEHRHVPRRFVLSHQRDQPRRAGACATARKTFRCSMDHFVARGCKEKGIPVKQFAKRAMEKMFRLSVAGQHPRARERSGASASCCRAMSPASRRSCSRSASATLAKTPRSKACAWPAS